jgi:hypothetical protein
MTSDLVPTLFRDVRVFDGRTGAIGGPVQVFVRASWWMPSRRARDPLLLLRQSVCGGFSGTLLRVA